MENVEIERNNIEMIILVIWMAQILGKKNPQMNDWFHIKMD
jgi:hypothetical protein